MRSNAQAGREGSEDHASRTLDTPRGVRSDRLADLGFPLEREGRLALALRRELPATAKPNSLKELPDESASLGIGVCPVDGKRNPPSVDGPLTPGMNAGARRAYWSRRVAACPGHPRPRKSAASPVEFEFVSRRQ
jgi:hypothetical protein